MNAGELGVASALLRAGARILIVGGHAVVFHGYVRPLKDLDLFVLPSADNAAKVAAGLRALGVTISEQVESGLATPFKQVPLPPPYAGVELLTSLKGVEFLEAEAEASFALSEGQRIPVISVRHLIISKTARSEPKDLADIEGLRSVCAV
jgi:hypothetical protein